MNMGSFSRPTGQPPGGLKTIVVPPKNSGAQSPLGPEWQDDLLYLIYLDTSPPELLDHAATQEEAAAIAEAYEAAHP